MVSFFLGELVLHSKRVVGNTWNELENVFEKLGVLGFPLSNCGDL
jgi:hypothetical protein